MSRKHKKTGRYLKFGDHLHILVSTVTGCISISVFTSLNPAPVGITSSVVGLKNLSSKCRI